MEITGATILTIVTMLSPEARQILANGWQLAKGRSWFSLAATSNEPTIQSNQMESLIALGLLTGQHGEVTAEDRGMYFRYDYYFTRLGFEVARRCASQQT